MHKYQICSATMAKKRRSSLPTKLLDEDELKLPKLPPWYIRGFMYGIVLFCFVLLFVLGPDPFGSSGSGSENINAPYSPNVISWDNFQQPNSEYSCYDSSTNPPFHICSQNANSDLQKQKKLVESGLVEQFQSSLLHYPSAGVLDIGHDSGFFTLLAAKLGRSVVAVDPFADNVLLVQEAARRNEITERITLIQNAISNTHDKIPFVETNPKKSQLQPNSPTSHNVYVDSITLNDVAVYANFKDVVIKIDIGGDECEAFETSGDLFKTKNVRQIFMEWNVNERRDKKCVETMMENFKKYNLKPFSASGVEFNEVDWQKSWKANNYVIWKQ